MNKRGNNRGQIALEYAILIAVAIAAILAMKIYMQRSVQGRLRESADEMGMQFALKNANFYRTITTTDSVTEEGFGRTRTNPNDPGTTYSYISTPGNVITSTEWTIPIDPAETVF